MGLNERNRLSQVVDNLHRNNVAKVFGVPIGVRCRDYAGQDLLRRIVATQFAVAKCIAQQRQDLICNLAVDDDTFGRTANPSAPHLGVLHNAHGFRDIGVLVDIAVIIAIQMQQRRHARLFLHQGHKPAPTARDHQIDCIRAVQQKLYSLAVAGIHQLHGVFGQARSQKALRQTGHNNPRGMKAF